MKLRLVTIHPTVGTTEMAAILTLVSEQFGRLTTRASDDGLIVYVDSWHNKRVYR